MKLSRPLATAMSVAVAFPLLLMLTVLFIPAGDIRDALNRGLKQQGYTLRTGYFGKAFPLGIKARNLEVLDQRGSLLKMDEATARIAVLPLLAGKVVIDYHAEIDKGTIEGHFSPLRKMEFTAVADGIRLEDIPFFRTVAEARVKGELDANIEFRGESNGFRGEARLSVRGAVLNGLKIGGMPLPDASYETIRGMYRVNGGRGTLESLSLEGRGIYVRLRGEIPFTSPPNSTPINLTLELMPKPAFMESQKLVFLLLAKYLASPGHYQIPVRGTLAKPAIL